MATKLCMFPIDLQLLCILHYEEERGREGRREGDGGEKGGEGQLQGRRQSKDS